MLQLGLIGNSVLTDIANAIRVQNGGTALYKHSEMAPAILALEWDVGYKPRAVLLADGTLEFNYLEKRRAVTSGKVVTAYEVSTEGYASSDTRLWAGVRLDIKKVVIDSSFT